MLPTISFRITDASGHNLAQVNDLPVPVSVTPAGHLVVDPLEPIVRRATQAFIDTWQQLCAEAEP